MQLGTIAQLTEIGVAVVGVLSFAQRGLRRLDMTEGIAKSTARKVECLDELTHDVKDLKDRVAGVEAELRPNHGSSHHDKIVAKLEEVRSDIPSDRLTELVDRVMEELNRRGPRRRLW